MSRHDIKKKKKFILEKKIYCPMIDIALTVSKEIKVREVYRRNKVYIICKCDFLKNNSIMQNFPVAKNHSKDGFPIDI